MGKVVFLLFVSITAIAWSMGTDKFKSAPEPTVAEKKTVAPTPARPEAPEVAEAGAFYKERCTPEPIEPGTGQMCNELGWKLLQYSGLKTIDIITRRWQQ